MRFATGLAQLAAQCRVEQWRDAMLAGARVNVSEQRPATHVHWRWAPDAPTSVEDCATDAINLQETRRILDDLLAYAEEVRADAAITDVVNIGIGGSDLGPRLLAQAFAATAAADGPRVHFVSNMDGHQMAQTLRGLSAESTLFIIVSKTFSTAETMQNAASARHAYVIYKRGSVFEVWVDGVKRGLVRLKSGAAELMSTSFHPG